VGCSPTELRIRVECPQRPNDDPFKFILRSRYKCSTLQM
jgi:hypothetical protein